MRNEYESKRMGERIKTLRIAQRMTQEELAEKAGLQRTHVVRIEQGKYNFTLSVLSAIADALGCTIEMVAKL